MDIHTKPLSIVSWNILAHVWKRRETTEDAHIRFAQIKDILRALDADVVCLQELDFEVNDYPFQNVVKNALSKYTFIGQQRPNGKPDGVAIFVNHATWIIKEKRNLDYRDAGSRVACVCKCVSLADPNREFILCNTHLTFPHNNFDLRMRKDQIRTCIEGVRIQTLAWQPFKKRTPVFLLGDFNTNQGINDDVYKIIVDEHHFKSSWNEVHQSEVGVTHKNHNGQETSVDFIFYKEVHTLPGGDVVDLPDIRISPLSAQLYPYDSPDTVWPQNFDASDHRPVRAVFQF